MSRFRGRVRDGFTLIELLVVIAIIAILIALLVPAVQKVREAAARTQCVNNLKNLALSCASFHDANKQFPQNWGGNIAWAPTATSASWSWIAYVLPFIDQGPLAIGTGISGIKAPTSSIMTTQFEGSYVAAYPITVLRCPSDPDSRQILWTNRADMGNGIPGGYAITNYKGVCGSNWEWGVATWNPGWAPPNQTGGQNGLDGGNGLLWRSNGTAGIPYTFTSITDGSSNTFMIGEDLPSRSPWCGAWVYANNASGTCAIALNDTIGIGVGNGDWGDNYGFGSGHVGGANFAFCDGTVHFVNSSIALSSYWALATIKGGEAVDISGLQ